MDVCHDVFFVCVFCVCVLFSTPIECGLEEDCGWLWYRIFQRTMYVQRGGPSCLGFDLVEVSILLLRTLGVLLPER